MTSYAELKAKHDEKVRKANSRESKRYYWKYHEKTRREREKNARKKDKNLSSY